MATAIQWRRGTTTQHSSFTGLAGEITVDTDLNTVIVHDGSTAGGHRIAKYTEVTSAAAGDISSVVAGAGLTGGATTGDATINVIAGGGITVSADAVSLNASSGTFTTGVQTFLAGGTLAGHIIPSADVTYDLGTSSKQWRDVYVGPGSLYINGQQVLQDNSGTIQISADANQNVGIVTSGSGDVELNASGTGVINIQSAITVDAGQTLTGTGGLTMASNINLNSNSVNNLPAPGHAGDATNKTYVDGATYLTGGTGITNSSGTFAIDATVITTTGTQTISGNKTFSGTTTVSGTLNSSGAQLNIADNLITLNSDATGTPSEDVGLIVERGDSTNVQFKWIEAADEWSFTNDGSAYQGLVGHADFSAVTSGDGSLSYNSSTGAYTYTGPTAANVRAHLSAGTGMSFSGGAFATTITQYTDALAKASITVNDAGGDGSLAISNGVITYTGPSAAEAEAQINAHLSGGTGITYTDGAISVDATVVSTSGTQTVAGAKTFSDNMIISGNLTVNGTQTIVNTETLTIDDNMIVLNNNEAGTPSEDSGIEIERGTSTNVKLQWKEASDRWEMFDGSSTYPLARTTADLTESGNLYYTDARANARVAAATGANLDLSSKDTGDLSESGNLYYTDARADARIAAADTGDLSEGSNEYFTTARARASISEGSTELAYNSTTGVLTFTQGSTSGVSEGSNLYYTDARADARIANASTSNLSEGTNLYHTTERVQDIAGAMFTANTESGITVTYDDADGTIDLTTSIAGFSTSNLSEGSNLYHTTARARASINGGTGITYNASTGAISLTDTGYVTGVTAGTGLSGGGTSGTVTLNVSGITVAELDGGAVQISSESFADNNTTLMTSAAIQDKIEAYGYSTTTGDITGVTAGAGLTGGATSGSADLAVGAGTGITVNANDIAVTLTPFSTSDLSEGTNLYYTSARADARVSAVVTNAFVDALNVDADTLDDLTSSQFLRSDANDSHSGTITPSSNNALNLGSSGLKYANVYATTFQGNATSAQYADLAEKYESDAELEAGTVVMFGGDKEVTACDSENCHAVAGVISTDPAYMMNAGAEGQFVALTGRVPTKVTGPVAKGDLMVSAGNGMAKANNDAQAGRMIGKAVGSSEGGEAVIEVLVNLM